MVKKKLVQASGSRKTAVARATVSDGTGLVRINGMPLDVYTPQISREKIQEPLLLLPDIAPKVDIKIKVFGGGVSSQAEAIRLAIARAVSDYSGSEQVKKTLADYSRHLLIADVRRKEPCKPNTSKARAKRQKSYR
jgi:small subunit ribosomal protein S9